MRRGAFWIAGIALLVFAAAAGLYAATANLTSEQVTSDVWMIHGMGGNVAVLRTGDGTLVVDTMTFNWQGAAIRRLAEELTGEPVNIIVNTHYHLDHTRGNPAFEAGTRVISTRRTLDHLKRTDASYFTGDAYNLLPGDTFEDDKTLRAGTKTVHLIHPGRGHTDGDLVAVFVEDGVLVAGDLFFHQFYPNIDLEAGGSITEWPATLEAVLALSFEHVIPGHGAVTNRVGLRAFQTFISELAAVVQTARQANWSRDQTIASGLLTADASYDEIRMIVPIGLNREFVLGRAWDEATNSFEAYKPATASGN